MGLGTEMRESGIVYSCLAGSTNDVGISCAMLAWAARHPHLSYWVTAISARRPRVKHMTGQPSRKHRGKFSIRHPASSPSDLVNGLANLEGIRKNFAKQPHAK